MDNFIFSLSERLDQELLAVKLISYNLRCKELP
jgi:hypothetical protein